MSLYSRYSESSISVSSFSRSSALICSAVLLRCPTQPVRAVPDCPAPPRTEDGPHRRRAVPDCPAPPRTEDGPHRPRPTTVPSFPTCWRPVQPVGPPRLHSPPPSRAQPAPPHPPPSPPPPPP